jgi:hypothetical protein
MSSIRLLPTVNTRALLAIDGPAAATFNTIVEAQPAYEGPAGNLITLALAATGTWVPNVGTLTFAGNAVADETVTIGTTVYTWKAAPGATPFTVLVGANAAASIVNLVAAINLNGTAGTTYGTGTTIHPTVRAHDGAGDTLVVHTKTNTILTAVGTLIASTQTMTNATWAAATLADGTDGTNVTFSVTGTAISCVFASTYSNVADFEAALLADTAVSALIRTKTAGTTPLYQLVVTDDDFSATNLSGGGSTASAAPTATNGELGRPAPFLVDRAVLHVRSTAGSGTMTVVDARLWGWSPELSRWCHIGELNGGTDIAELSADLIDHSELIIGLRPFSRFYLQIGSLGGTATEITADLLCAPAAAWTT